MSLLHEHPPRIDLSRDALFLDLDGTLADIAPHPDAVVASPERTQILRRLALASAGRVAILTGRTLRDADRILAGSIAAVAAVHGLERRCADGASVSQLPSRRIAEAKVALETLVAAHHGLLLEDKGSSLAVHYRAAPAEEQRVKAATAALAAALGLTVQDGAMVSELRTPGPHKGDALRGFMQAEPFAGRRPVMVGDDLTDEHAFEAARALGGHGVLVGAPRTTAAAYRLASVADVLAWLDEGSRT